MKEEIGTVASISRTVSRRTILIEAEQPISHCLFLLLWRLQLIILAIAVSISVIAKLL